MKTIYKKYLGFMLISFLSAFGTAKAQQQDKEPVTARQIKEGTVPGLKYGPKKTAPKFRDNDKQKNYRGTDSKAYLFTDYQKPQQGMNQVSKQISPKAAGTVKLPSDAPLSAEKEEVKVVPPKLPTQEK